MIIWRALFDAIRVPWRDRGSNCSRGHINCRCPWCGNMDPSYHLTINEENGAYFCLRTPDKMHSGRSLPWLLLGLGVDSSEIDRLIEEHTDQRQPVQLVAAPARILDWNRFEPASDYDAATEYLASRGYPDPHEIIRSFGLRFTKVGRFSWRILMPLRSPGDRGSVLAFTGRATREQQSPRYLTNDPMEGSLFLPANPICTPIAALLGTALPAEKKLHLGRIVRKYPSIIMLEGPFDALTLAWAVPDLRLLEGAYYIADTDQSPADTYRLIDELELIPGMPHITRLEPPRGFGDIGEMADRPGEIREWISQYMSRSTSLSGRDPSRTSPAAS
jgi:hypothetical protein